MNFSLLVVINIVHVDRITVVETKRYTPISGNRYRPKTSDLPSKRALSPRCLSDRIIFRRLSLVNCHNCMQSCVYRSRRCQRRRLRKEGKGAIKWTRLCEARRSGPRLLLDQSWLRISAHGDGAGPPALFGQVNAFRRAESARPIFSGNKSDHLCK